MSFVSIIRTAAIYTATLAIVGWTLPVGAADPYDLDERYRIVANLDHYPQDTPKATIRSIIVAIEEGNARYVMAHLVSPTQVDERLNGNARALERLVSGMTPAKSRYMLDQLERHLLDGNWDAGNRLTTSQAEGVPDLSLERIGDRWFMHNEPRRPTKRGGSR